MSRPWTIGVVRHGESDPPPLDARRTAPERCAGRGHPGVTHNPWHDRTWCLCGLHTYKGRPSTVDDHLTCCGGPLTELIA